MADEEKNMESIQRGEATAEAGSGSKHGTAFEAQCDEKDYEKESYPQGNIEAQGVAKNASSDGHSSRTAVPPPDAPPASGPPAAETSNHPEEKRTKLQTFIIMLCLCASVFLAALDTTIITTALPTISEYFESSAGYTWIGSSYLLSNSISTPVWGKLSDIWGRKPILLCAAGVFLLGSGLAGGSSSIAMLIAARAIQGVGGGGLIILSNICISDLFSMRSRGKYFGVCGPISIVMSWRV
jgi:Major Facilitator Superfamily